VLALLMSAILGASADAFATDSQANAQFAQALFDEAKKLMAENNFAAACPKLAESQRLEPSGGTILHLGICHEGQGKTATAYAELNEAVSAARRDGRADRESVAQVHLASLAPKLVRLTIGVAPEARMAGLIITWNDTAVPEAQWGIAFPVDPGEHVVSASAPGRRKWTTRVDVTPQSPGAAVAIPALPIEPTATAPANEASTHPPGTAEQVGAGSAGASPQRAIGIVVGAAGLVALGAAGVFELRAQSLAKDRDEAAAAGDAETTAGKHDSAKNAEVVAAILGGVGIAALGTGVVLFVTAPSHSAMGALAPMRRVAIAPMLGGGAFGIALRATSGGSSW
jgi:hypothetical protein